MLLTSSISESIIHRLEAGEREVRIGAPIEEYFELLDELEDSPYVITYEDYEIVTKMGQATDIHELICGNIIGIFYMNLRNKNYRTYGSNCVIYSQECNRSFNPDVLVIKGLPELMENGKKVKPILNPHIVVEVMSDSNSGQSFIDKLNCYQQIPSLQQIILIEQSKPLVNVFNRTDKDDVWINKFYKGLTANAEIDGFEVSLTDLYQHILI